MVLAVVLAAEQVPIDLPTSLIQYGAIGILLGFFVWWSRKDKEQSDTRWAEVNKQMFEMQERQIDAMNASSDAAREQVRIVSELNQTLRERPCLKKENERG
jgi:hypothetical protein